LPVFSNSVSTSSKTVPQFRNPEGYHKSEKKSVHHRRFELVTLHRATTNRCDSYRSHK